MMIEHEDIYLLMMNALDGELSVSDETELASHLQTCSDCRQEWQALRAVDRLFRQTPALAPAAGFTQRTLARLPHRRYRIWAVGLIYGLLLLSGVAPLLLGVWAVSYFGPVFDQPALVQSTVTAVSRTVQLAGTIVGALAGGFGEVVAQQPAILGWLLVMVGVVSLWTGVLRQLLLQPIRLNVGSGSR